MGLQLDSKLLFSQAIKHRLQIARLARIQLLPILLSNTVSTNTKTKIYKMILRTTALYGCQIYCTAANTHIQKLQKFQNQILRLILDAPRTTSIEELHQRTSMQYIEDQIKKITTTHLNKAIAHQNPTIKNSVTSRRRNKRRLPIPHETRFYGRV